MSVVALSKKICLLGDFAVGKTSLVRRFVYNLFDDKYLSTIGVKVSRKAIALPGDGEVTELTLMVWDLAGGEEFDQVRASYLRGAAGGILVCDLTRPTTLLSLANYARDLRRANPAAQIIVAANKQDLAAQQRIAEEEVSALAEQLVAPYVLTSARTGDCVEETFRYLGRLLLER
ncbi:MAG: Ras family protein [Chloroflexi bacterium ADurb.Bin325]|nr:MAG: Ras family protein [Chloroflexi bacterium ADurb.Bin325]